MMWSASSQKFKIGFLIFVLIAFPLINFAQIYPDTVLFNRVLQTIATNAELKVTSIKPYFHKKQLLESKSEQCVSFTSVRQDKKKKKLLIIWQIDNSGKWSYISHIITGHFKLIDIDNDRILEVECIDKESDKIKRDVKYRLISFRNGEAFEMYRYHQYEYINSTYIMDNFTPYSTFSEKHKVIYRDIDRDKIPELTDHIDIKYRKLPCCDHHFEYGIRQKKLVFRLRNGKFELD